MQELAKAGQRLVNREHAGHGQEVGQRTGAQNAADVGGDTEPREHPGEREGVTDGHEGGEEEEGIAHPAAGRGGEQEMGNPPLHESKDNDKDKIQGIVGH